MAPKTKTTTPVWRPRPFIGTCDLPGCTYRAFARSEAAIHAAFADHNAYVHPVPTSTPEATS